jgi:hypothetical protein
MVCASAPKMKKSYHSNAVPADEAAMTRFIDHGLSCRSATVAMSRSYQRRDSG